MLSHVVDANLNFNRINYKFEFKFKFVIETIEFNRIELQK